MSNTSNTKQQANVETSSSSPTRRDNKTPGFTKLTLDFRGTWLPVLILSATIIATMLVVAGLTYDKNAHEEHHPHERAVKLAEIDEIDATEEPENAEIGSQLAPLIKLPRDTGHVGDDDDDDESYYRHRDKNHRRNHIIQLAVTFFSVCVGLFCVYFECGTSLELWLLAVPWSIWLVFSVFTLSGGIDVAETVSVIANSIAITAILTTYSYAVKSSRKLIFLLIILSTASLLFFPHFGSNAFSIPLSIMATHVATFCATYAIIGYFDALMGERMFSRGDIGNQIIRMLRVGWVLFVETRLLFFLVPQILIIILNLNYLMNSDAVISGSQVQIHVANLESICQQAPKPPEEEEQIFSLFK